MVGRKRERVCARTGIIDGLYRNVLTPNRLFAASGGLFGRRSKEEQPLYPPLCLHTEKMPVMKIAAPGRSLL